MCSKIERENRLNIKPVGKGQNEGSYSKIELIKSKLKKAMTNWKTKTQLDSVELTNTPQSTKAGSE